MTSVRVLVAVSAIQVRLSKDRHTKAAIASRGCCTLLVYATSKRSKAKAIVCDCTFWPPERRGEVEGWKTA